MVLTALWLVLYWVSEQQKISPITILPNVCEYCPITQYQYRSNPILYSYVHMNVSLCDIKNIMEITCVDFSRAIAVTIHARWYVHGLRKRRGIFIDCVVRALHVQSRSTTKIISLSCLSLENMAGKALLSFYFCLAVNCYLVLSWVQRLFNRMTM